MANKVILTGLLALLCIGVVSATIFKDTRMIDSSSSNSIYKSLNKDSLNREFTDKGSILPPSVSGLKPTTLSSTGGGSLITQWVWNGQQCVKADILGLSYSYYPNKNGVLTTVNAPHKIISTNDDGSITIRRIISGKYGVAFTKEDGRLKYQKEPICDKETTNIEPLEIRWFRK